MRRDQNNDSVCMRVVSLVRALDSARPPSMPITLPTRILPAGR